MSEATTHALTELGPLTYGLAAVECGHVEVLRPRLLDTNPLHGVVEELGREGLAARLRELVDRSVRLADARHVVLAGSDPFLLEVVCEALPAAHCSVMLGELADTTVQERVAANVEPLGCETFLLPAVPARHAGTAFLTVGAACGGDGVLLFHDSWSVIRHLAGWYMGESVLLLPSDERIVTRPRRWRTVSRSDAFFTEVVSWG